GFALAEATTAQLAIVNWNQLVLYPKGEKSDDVKVAANLKLPPHWKFGTALPVANQAGEDVSFEPVSLTTLVDSPVLTGINFRSVKINEGQTPSHEIVLASDSAAALEMTPEVIAQ